MRVRCCHSVRRVGMRSPCDWKHRRHLRNRLMRRLFGLNFCERHLSCLGDIFAPRRSCCRWHGPLWGVPSVCQCCARILMSVICARACSRCPLEVAAVHVCIICGIRASPRRTTAREWPTRLPRADCPKPVGADYEVCESVLRSWPSQTARAT